MSIMMNRELFIISPLDINSSQFNSPMSRTFPLFPNTVITSSILNGLVSDKYMPAIMFPKRFCEAKPITSADRVPGSVNLTINL